MAGANKYVTAAGGGVTITAASTATDKTATLPAADMTVAGLEVAQTFTKPQTASVYALTTSVAVDASTYQAWSANVNGSTFTVSNPTGGTSGTYYTLYVTFTTSNTIAFGTNFKGISGYVPTATAGAEDHLTFRCDGTYFECTGYATNIKA